MCVILIYIYIYIEREGGIHTVYIRNIYLAYIYIYAVCVCAEYIHGECISINEMNVHLLFALWYTHTVLRTCVRYCVRRVTAELTRGVLELPSRSNRNICKKGQ